MPGIITSSNTTSTGLDCTTARASSPLRAVSTPKYSALSRDARSLKLARMSSTTRTRAVIRDTFTLPDRRLSCFAEVSPNGRQKRHDRDRLGDIGLAAALSDARLVTLHGERRHRDHRDLAQVVIVLQPLGDFEPGNLRQLDVHQDQIRPVLARQPQGLHARSCLQGAIPVGVEQIVEELHVELVVFHNEHGLGQLARLRPPAGAGPDAFLIAHAAARSPAPRTPAPILRGSGSRLCFRTANQLFMMPPAATRKEA